MKTTIFAATAALAGALAMAGAADAKPHKHGDQHRAWDAQHHHWVEQNWTPPGLAKKPGGMPPGQYKKLHDYNVGSYLPNNYYRNDSYYVPNSYYGQYNLPAPPAGYQWVRVGNDVYLAQTRTGLISQVIADLFN
ncbi:MAG TPA: RcnB family protein [Caulobacteraceae bacterium]